MAANVPSEETPFPLYDIVEPPPASPATHYLFARRNTGPSGSYESKEYNGGLYVRVDVPGVNNFSHNESNVSSLCEDENGPALVTAVRDSKVFCFRAYTNRNFPPSSRRTYEGFIKTENPFEEARVELRVKDGVMRVFIPGAKGELHFYNNSGLEKVSTVWRGEPVPPNVHDCMPFIGVTLVRAGSEMMEINEEKYPEMYPQRIKGVDGVASITIKRDGEDNCVIARMDVPDLSESNLMEKKVVDNAIFVKTSPFSPIHPSEDNGRHYVLAMGMACGCCKFGRVNLNILNGLLLAMARYEPK